MNPGTSQPPNDSNHAPSHARDTSAPSATPPATPPDNATRLRIRCDAIHAPNLLAPAPHLAPPLPTGAFVTILIEPAPNPRAWIERIDPDLHPDHLPHPEPNAHPNTIQIDRRGAILMPALINAHAHLDLSHIGPCPADPEEPGSPASSFAAFGAHVLANRLDDPDAIRRAVCTGAQSSLNAGVAAIADIAGVWRTEPLEALRRSGLRGISCLEVFGQGQRVDASIARLNAIIQTVQATIALDDHRCALALSPHAPYSASKRLFLACQQLAEQHNLRIATHLAECPEEREFIATARGPIRTLLERLGGVDEATEAEFSHELTPIDHIKEALSHRWSVVHVNDCDDAGIEALKHSGATVVYCPRASAYFAHERHFGPHRYRDMIAAGIPVALGTDSVICLPPDQADALSPLDDARFLHARDGTDPDILLNMLYEPAARALAIDPNLVRIPTTLINPPANPPRPHEILGLIAIDTRDIQPAAAHAHSPAHRVMASSAPAERITQHTR
ncbi:MAG: amidohydrolase family protein [Phycisphaerales bacterium]